MRYWLPFLYCVCLTMMAHAQIRVGLGGGYYTSTVDNEAIDPNIDFQGAENIDRWVGGYYAGGSAYLPITSALALWTDLHIVQQRTARNGGLNTNNLSYFEFKPRLQYRFGEYLDIGVGPSIGYTPLRNSFGLRRETNFGIAAAAQVELGDFYIQVVYTHGLSNVAFGNVTVTDINGNAVFVEQRTRSIQLGIGYLWGI